MKVSKCHSVSDSSYQTSWSLIAQHYSSFQGFMQRVIYICVHSSSLIEKAVLFLLLYIDFLLPLSICTFFLCKLLLCIFYFHYSSLCHLLNCKLSNVHSGKRLNLWHCQWANATETQQSSLKFFHCLSSFLGQVHLLSFPFDGCKPYAFFPNYHSSIKPQEVLIELVLFIRLISN